MPAPLVIQCAITGSIDPDTERRANLPSSPEAIIASALAAWRAGAAVIHLHARRADGMPTQDREAYRELVDALRDADCEAIVNLSCGSAGGRALRDERLGPLELAPEMASFDCGSINFREQLFEGDLPFLRRMAGKFREFGVRPEVECFDTGHVGLALQLRDEGLLDAPMVMQFVLGVPGSGVPATVAMVEHLRAMVPPDWPWSVCAIGRAQLTLNTYCIIAGGHVRTGLEDNLWYRRGEPATNPMLVERIVRLAAELDRPVATPGEARAILGV